MTSKAEPVAVSNLRRIWNLKKSEMQITQAQAAKRLGWTQGAFSQYLNNITSLNSTAVIKLANFLGVDPLEIDPEIVDALPSMKRINVRYKVSNVDQAIESHIYSDRSADLFAIELDEKITGAPELPKGSLAICTVSLRHPKLTSSPNHFIIRQKEARSFEYVSESICPPKTNLTSKWLVHYFQIH